MRLPCTKGDTLVFGSEYSYFKTEKYSVSDSCPIIVDLIRKEELDNEGRRKLYGRAWNSSNYPKVFIGSSVIDKGVFSIGYHYFPNPFFADNPNIPVLNKVYLGLNVSKENSDYYVFPNIGLYIRSFYQYLFNSEWSFTFFTPTVTMGYWLNDFKTGKNGFGYELGMTLVNFSFINWGHTRNVSVNIKYNSYLTPDGTFMLSLCLNKAFPNNTIPKFIKKQLPR